MKHAYLIIAHSDIEVFKTLISLIDDVRNDIYVHIDQKVDITPFTAVTTQHSRITFLNDSTQKS